MITCGVAANAFKGSLDAIEATEAIARGLEKSTLPCEVLRLPLADGGDGTLAVMLTQAGSTRRTVEVLNPLGETIQADYGLLGDGETAVIEMALASGLAILGSRRDALHATTYGTGQLMRHAIDNGAKRIILGVGGSATTDGGAGCLQALGVKLLDKNGSPIGYGGAALANVHTVEPIPINAEILILCDVENPPIGENGSAAVFAPQKGASPEQVALLDNNLTHFFSQIAEQTGQDVTHLKGGGAAGAIAAGLAALAGAKLVPGAATLIDFLGYREKIQQCQLIFTGEGQLDAQTIQGKAPAVIAQEAAHYGIPVVAIAGSIPPEQNPLFQAMFSLMPRPASLQEAMLHAESWLHHTAMQIGNLLAVSPQRNEFFPNL